MQIVIEIPNGCYEELNNGQFPVQDAYRLVAWIKDGTPLPKGHGRLIDADKLEQSMYHNAFEIESDMQKWESGCWIRYKMFENNIDNAPTIIEGGQTDE